MKANELRIGNFVSLPFDGGNSARFKWWFRKVLNYSWIYTNSV